MSSLSITDNPHFVGGRRRDGEDRIDVVNPATEKVVATVPAGTVADVDAAVEAAADAFASWSAVPLAARADVLRGVVKALSARQDDIAAMISAEMGAPIMFARHVQAALPPSTASASIEAAQSINWTEHIGHSVISREPAGVVAAITPWNFPLHQAVAKAVPALLAGCTVVLKPSELAPSTANLLAEVMQDAGVPDGAFNVVHGRGPVVGEALARHPLVDMVSFTGSTVVGRRVSVLAAETVKRVTLELGGKSASLVLADAEPVAAVRASLANCFMNAGQMCSAWTRLLVPAERHDDFADLARAEAETFTVGDPTSPGTRIGPLVSADQRDRVQRYIARGIAAGATVVSGGPAAPDGLQTGYYVRPTIFGRVRPDAVIAQEEIFGPVLSIIPYEDEEQAVAIANGTRYGLAGAVFSGDPDHAVAVAARLRTGQVDINGAAFNAAAPFGGYRQSGNGRELGAAGLAEFCEVKSVQR